MYEHEWLLAQRALAGEAAALVQLIEAVVTRLAHVARDERDGRSAVAPMTQRDQEAVTRDIVRQELYGGR